MSLIEIDQNPSAAKLRTFGLLLPVFFACVGALLQWRWRLPTAALASWIAGTALVVLYLAIPRFRRPLYVGWMYAVVPIGFCVSYVVLAALFFLILTPIGFVRRMFGEVIPRPFDREAATYWMPVRRRSDKREYLRQF